MKHYVIIVLFLVSGNSFSVGHQFRVKDNNRKGDAYLYWGYNRSAYSSSDIQFTGNDYNFSLGNVAATDRQSPFDWEVYFNPGLVSIPQYNARVGYFFSDHCEISLGADHMKYVVTQGQTVSMNGEVGSTYPRFEGEYINDQRTIDADFLRYEHTDGLNFINLAFKRYDDILEYKKFRLGISEGVEVGGLVPKTNVTLMGGDRYDEFKWSGYGFSGVGAITLRIYNNFFIQSEVKTGFMDLGAVRTSVNEIDRARQNFFYVQGNILFGFTVSLNKKEKKVSE
jgi:hypothetical protein